MMPQVQAVSLCPSPVYSVTYTKSKLGRIASLLGLLDPAEGCFRGEGLHPELEPWYPAIKGHSPGATSSIKDQVPFRVRSLLFPGCCGPLGTSWGKGCRNSRQSQSTRSGARLQACRRLAHCLSGLTLLQASDLLCCPLVVFRFLLPGVLAVANSAV